MRFAVDGAGATPASGNFETTPLIGLSSGVVYTVAAGIDCDKSTTLEYAERSLSGQVTTLDFTLGQAEIEGNRTSAPVESLFPVRNSEHFEVDGTFHFELTGNGVGSNSLERYIVEDLDGINEVISSGQGLAVNHTWVYDDRGDVRVRFYGDRDENSQFDSWSEFEISREIWVQELNVRSLNIKASNKIAELVANPGAAGIQLVQAVLDGNSTPALCKDSEDDWRSCLKLVVNSDTFVIFTVTPGSPPDPAETNADILAHLDDDVDITFLKGIAGRRGSSHPNHSINESVINWTLQGTTTIVHELIHTALDIDMHATDRMRIFCDGATKNRAANKLSMEEAHGLD